MNLPQTTLFMLMSLDGKISTGSNDERDFDKDFPTLPGVAQGLGQYYELEKDTDLFSFNTGKVMAKVGWNEQKEAIVEIPVTFILVDNKPHLTSQGLSNLIMRAKKVFLVTTNNQHPALSRVDSKLEVIRYKPQIDFSDLFGQLGSKGVDKLTIQSGGEMNAQLLRAGLIDFVSIVVAPVLVGGRETSTLVDGDSLQRVVDLKKLRPLRLIESNSLQDSYLHLRYVVIN